MSTKSIVGLLLSVAGVVVTSLGHLIDPKWFLLAGALLLPGCLLLFDEYQASRFLRNSGGGMDVYDSTGFRHGGHEDSFHVGGNDGAAD